ncbi:hypothetical protein TUM20286_61830 [Pseudomonas tohonis]|uniref:Uncharacterized protein n=1 Tax=Pseudomonas tohonis TaxID=2725477 RepID=A0ABQ4WAH9_9PSED|nr:hypothetical protein TUM20286_61830 [Pseudomonas tohonis]
MNVEGAPYASDELRRIAEKIAQWRPTLPSDRIIAQVLDRAEAAGCEPETLAEKYLVHARDGLRLPWVQE